jgi:hypothetical protein
MSATNRSIDGSAGSAMRFDSGVAKKRYRETEGRREREKGERNGSDVLVWNRKKERRRARKEGANGRPSEKEAVVRSARTKQSEDSHVRGGKRFACGKSLWQNAAPCGGGPATV